MLTSNDLMAMGALRAIIAAGLRAPDDFSVVGFDENAFHALYRSTQQGSKMAEGIKLGTKLVVRNSTASRPFSGAETLSPRRYR
jgi:LacI family transcriptional regulator